MSTLQAKLGDTFRLVCRRKNPDGSPRTLADTTIAAQLRRGNSVITLTPAVLDLNGGLFELTADQDDTEDWRRAAYLCDIQFTSTLDGRWSTRTFVVEILKDQTANA